MSRSALRHLLGIAPLLAASALVPLAGVGSAAAATGSTTSASVPRTFSAPATTAFHQTTTGSAAPTTHQLAPDLEALADAAAGITPGGHRVANRSGSVHAHRLTPPAPAPVGATAQPLTTSSPGTAGFAGLDILDQREANQGNQFYVEPPDQALCVGGGQVVEAVNDVLGVYSTTGTRQGSTDLNTLLGYPAQYDRTTGVNGPFVTDPVCTYDQPTGTFFLVTLTLEVTAAGDFTGNNTLDVATTKNPLGSWAVRHLAVQDDGSQGTPDHGSACPCIGDYPHIGADAKGFYITTNEYPFFADGFVAAQIYAFPKAALAKASGAVTGLQVDTRGMDAGKPGFTVWPALSPAGQYATAASGTEYFLSSNAAEETGGNYHGTQVVTWSLTGTNSLGTPRPSVQLHSVESTVPDYYLPPLATQKAGPVPLADCLNLTACAKQVLAKPSRYKETEGALDASDTRMQQVTYTGGTLYSGLGTAVQITGDSAVRAGIALYTVRPTTTASSISATVTTRTIGVPGNNVTYPTVGVTGAGQGLVSYTLSGSDWWPSQAYTRIGASTATVTVAGLGPQDGFSEYRSFGDPPQPRWGDYGASAVVGGDIWIANETINQTCTFAQYSADPLGRCGGTRGALGNWGTAIAKVSTTG